MGNLGFDGLRMDPKGGPRWSQNGSGMDPKWIRNGPEMDPDSARNERTNPDGNEPKLFKNVVKQSPNGQSGLARIEKWPIRIGPD